jgi:peroxiredoxin Q/BCP
MMRCALAKGRHSGVVRVGDQAPEFATRDDGGNVVRLRDLRGRRVVLYFYPKDDTPGCIKEACSFRDEIARLQQAGAVVLGVSPDGVESHRNFKEKYGLPFPLLADEDHAIAEAYGAWVEKNTYGRKSWGVARVTFLIGPDGRVEHVWEKVNPEGHAEEVLAVLNWTIQV